MPDNSALTYKDYVKLMHWLANRHVVRRAFKAGFKIDHDDAFQEVALIWTQCVKRYDSELGVKFSTYFGQAVYHEYRNICRRVLGVGREITDSLSSMAFQADGGGEGVELGDLLVNEDAENPEIHFARNEGVEQSLAASPLLKRLLELAVNPDEEMQRELEALQAQHKWAARISQRAPECQAPSALTPRMVGKMMQFNWRDRRLMIQAFEGID